MTCQYFGVCGSCTLYQKSYAEQLDLKVERFKKLLSPFFSDDVEIFCSPSEHFRARAELKIYREKDKISLGMNTRNRKTIPIENCKIVAKPIYDAIPKIVDIINSNKILKDKIYAIDFLSSNQDELLVSMIYHKLLNENWIEKSRELLDSEIKLMGRSRKQKVSLGEEFVTDVINTSNRSFKLRKYEGAFSQPNRYINEMMIDWACRVSDGIGGDLLELYCGNGNFTIPLSCNFEKVFATEISKSSIKTLNENIELNNIKNITIARLSGKECIEAIKREREFFRLKEIDLDSFRFSTVFVDPPRAGLGKDVAEFIERFDKIIYISCNIETLIEDLEILSKSHDVAKAAAFDQFPWTNHLESALFLQKRTQG